MERRESVVCGRSSDAWHGIHRPLRGGQAIPALRLRCWLSAHLMPSLVPPLGSPDEADLIHRAREGDRSALETLLARHRPWVLNLALRMVWRRDVAEDATQEIMLKVVRHLGAFEGRSRFSTWLERADLRVFVALRPQAQLTAPGVRAEKQAAAPFRAPGKVGERHRAALGLCVGS